MFVLYGILSPRPGGTGAAEFPKPRQVREEATVRRSFWAPPANLPGLFFKHRYARDGTPSDL
jgi:hypothetical protein